MLSTAEVNQHIWWTHVKHSPSIADRCERSSFWFNVFSRPLFFLTLLELSLECNSMWWDITADSTCKICQKKLSFFINFISLPAVPILTCHPQALKEPGTSPPHGQNSKVLPDVSEGTSQRWPFPSRWKTPKHMQMGKNSCPILSPRTLFKAHWSSCKYLQSLAASWITALCTIWQTMFYRQYHFLDTMPDTHPWVRTSVHKGLRSKVHRDFII